ncbi:MAG: hypothetical protein M1540_08880 [Candidatus Bathyarchaeota archaeon]|nr:hypothetical protein [Candidatus Bathyarchaeota archaeon]
MGYCEVEAVKLVLQIPSETETFDEEISGCIVSADALVDSLLKQKGLSVSSPTPQNIIDASAILQLGNFGVAEIQLGLKRSGRKQTGSWMSTGKPKENYRLRCAKLDIG